MLTHLTEGFFWKSFQWPSSYINKYILQNLFLLKFKPATIMLHGSTRINSFIWHFNCGGDQFWECSYESGKVIIASCMFCCTVRGCEVDCREGCYMEQSACQLVDLCQINWLVNPWLRLIMSQIRNNWLVSVTTFLLYVQHCEDTISVVLCYIN